MKDSSDKWTLFTDDTEKNVWYKDDDFQAKGFGKVGDELFAIDEKNNLLWSMYGSVGTLEDDFEWEAIFGIQGAEYGRGNYGSRVRNDTPGSRYISRFDIRMYLEETAKAELYIQYNDMDWIDKGEIRGRRLKSFVLPVVPVRCDHLRFKLKGSGKFRIYSICRNLEVGSDGGTY